MQPQRSAFEYYFAFTKPEGEFKMWKDEIGEFEYSPSKSFFELVVPTSDTVCYAWFL
jgi:hypothetical protein